MPWAGQKTVFVHLLSLVEVKLLAPLLQGLELKG